MPTRNSCHAATVSLVNKVAVKYSRNIESNPIAESILPKWHLQNLIDAKKVQFHVSGNIKISLKTIKKRRFRLCLTSNHCGTQSPLDELDKVILPIVIQSARIRQQWRDLKSLNFQILLFLKEQTTRSCLYDGKSYMKPIKAVTNLGKLVLQFRVLQALHEMIWGCGYTWAGAR